MKSEKLEQKDKYLIDTSALYPILLKGISLDPNKFFISTLAEYEIGNVIWKEDQKKKLKDPKRIATIFAESIKDLERLKLDSIVEVLKLASDRNLTFHDASYAYIAEKEHLRLVTQDNELLEKTKDAIGIDEISF